ncbi:hypothetical protein [Peribacillus muralis]|uniref:hypothetical protein n=1 Tax=Peribacillus muralis TaxID=264697 RepID=UPI00366ACD8F
MIEVQIHKSYRQLEFHLHIHTEWNETEGATLLREMRVYLRPRRRSAEEAQGPPAERERLKCNETIKVQILQNRMQLKFDEIREQFFHLCTNAALSFSYEQKNKSC